MSKEMIQIEDKIHWIRNQKVMLDRDLAELYGVETKNLNKAVKRNLARFPEDFMFQLTYQELRDLRFQIGTLKNTNNIQTKYLPYVFTEQGVAMLSSVLRSNKAVFVNIQIMRTFVKMRKLLSNHQELLKKIDTLEKNQKSQSEDIQMIFKAIKALMKPEPKERKQIGFIR